MTEWKQKFAVSGITQERIAILAGINAARLSQISRGLVEPTEAEQEKIESVLRSAEDNPDFHTRIARLTGIPISQYGGVSRMDMVVCSLLAGILEEIRELRDESRETVRNTPEDTE